MANSEEDFVIVVLDNKMALDTDSKKQYVITTWMTQSDFNNQAPIRVVATKTKTHDTQKSRVSCYTAKVSMRVPAQLKIDDKNEHLMWIHLEEDQSTTSYPSLDKVNQKSLKADFPSTKFKRKAPYPVEGGIGYIVLDDVINHSHGGCVLYDMKLSGGDIPVDKACAFVARTSSIREIDVDAALEIRARSWMAETQSGNIYLKRILDKYITYFMAPFSYDSKHNTVTRSRTVGGPSTAGLVFPMAPFTIGRSLRDTYVMEDERPLSAREKAVDIPHILYSYLEYTALRHGKNIFDIVSWVDNFKVNDEITACQSMELQGWNQIITGSAVDAATAIRYTADVSEIHVEGKGNVRVQTESWDSLLSGNLGDDCEGLARFVIGIINMYRYLDWEDLCKANPKQLALFKAVRFVRSFFACFMVVGSVSSAYVAQEGRSYPTIGSTEDTAHIGGHGWAMDAPIAKLLSMLEDCMNHRSEPSQDSKDFRERLFNQISETYKIAKGLIKDYVQKIRPAIPMKIDVEKKMGMLVLEGTGPVISDLQMLAFPPHQYEFTKARREPIPDIDVVPRLPRLNHLPGERWTDFYKTAVDVMGRDINTFFGGYSARTVTYQGGSPLIGAQLEHFIMSQSTGFFVNHVYTAQSFKTDDVYQNYLKYIIANRPREGIAEYVHMEKYNPIKAHIDFDSIEEFVDAYKSVATDYLSHDHGNFLQMFCDAVTRRKTGSHLKENETVFSVTKRPSLFYLDKEVSGKMGTRRYIKQVSRDLSERMQDDLKAVGGYYSYDGSVKLTRVKVMIIRHSQTTESRIEIMYCHEAEPKTPLED